MKKLTMVIYIFIWILGSVQSDKCYNNSSNGVLLSWFCCNNHEEKNGTCQECDIGYVSKDGFPCMPCLSERWGKKCGYICSCQQNERCDSVHGCIERSTVFSGYDQVGKCYNKSSKSVTKKWFCCNNHEEKNGKCVGCGLGYVSKDGFPCMSCLPGRWGRKCGYMCSCQPNERCDNVYGCVETGKTPKYNSTIEEDSISTTDTHDGLRLIIYSMSAGSIVVMIALASFCFKYKRKVEQLYKSRSRRIHHDQASSEKANVQYSRNNEGGYDVIDEGDMIDDAFFSRSKTSHEQNDPARIRQYASVNQGRSSSSYTEDVCKTLGDGYLNPYQPIIEADVHAYRTLADETTDTSRKIISANSGSNRSVLSYQPILPYVDAHKYTPIDEKVSKHPTNDHILLEVHTDGCGIHIEEGKQMFLSFK
ncbi:uncharacterized protein [Mytilus edulis]|uniref:uncharacterized protein n=1 Tax=Mytilus edulis TaxID=6550 RepID=UPI0039EE30E7